MEIDVLHDEARPALADAAALEQACEVRVLETGENAALCTEALDGLVILDPAPQLYSG